LGIHDNPADSRRRRISHDSFEVQAPREPTFFSEAVGRYHSEKRCTCRSSGWLLSDVFTGPFWRVCLDFRVPSFLSCGSSPPRLQPLQRVFRSTVSRCKREVGLLSVRADKSPLFWIYFAQVRFRIYLSSPMALPASVMID
jgi:hypothetical protein